MATAAMAEPTVMLPPAARNRGKDQVPWSEDIWKRIDAAVTEEMIRTRVAAKFLPLVQVPRKVTTVPSDVVVVPNPKDQDQALSVDESQTNRVNEFWTEFRLTPAQVEEEGSKEMAMTHGQPCSTGISLGLRSSNSLAQAEDTVLFNGRNAFNSPLFTPPGGLIQFRDPNLKKNLDLGLLNVDADGSVTLPPAVPGPIDQIILVHPARQNPLQYAENTLGAVAQGFSNLQALEHYEHYALVLHTIPYADLHTALPTTLSTPFEPISHIVKAGIYGTGTLPPFNAAAGQPTGLPDPNKLPQGFIPAGANILYTGVLVSLSGNNMDLVRGLLDTDAGGKELDVATTFNQKDVNENYRFRVLQRFALRLKDQTAVVLFLFLDK
jgi:uncharacterized linocin/CFP29 family protein